MTKKKALQIADILLTDYPNPIPALKFSSNFELLIAVILSAQCTDERVNKVTETLFKRANTPEKMAQLTQEELEKYIFSCGLYRSKAEHIISASKDILVKFNGQVPDNLKDLQSLSGVGRKTANVVFSVAFGGCAIAVDTHVFRVSNRLGLANSKDVLKTQKQLEKNLPKELWIKFHYALVLHGRYVCKSQKPNCESCKLKSCCKYFKKGENYVS